MKLTARTIGMLLLASSLYLPACSAPQVGDQLPTSSNLQEDDPGWDCNLHGNRICGDPDNVHAAEAWKAWDSAPENWRAIKGIDTSKPYRVDYMGYASRTPLLDDGIVAVPMGATASQRYFVFRATVTDGSCDPDSCDPDEGEAISAEELAELNK